MWRKRMQPAFDHTPPSARGLKPVPSWHRTALVWGFGAMLIAGSAFVVGAAYFRLEQSSDRAEWCREQGHTETYVGFNGVLCVDSERRLIVPPPQAK